MSTPTADTSVDSTTVDGSPSPLADEAHHSRNVRLLFITLVVVMLLASLSQMVLSSALPTLVGELGGVDHLSWVITAYLLAATVTMPVYGSLSDRLGRRPLLVVAIVLFTAGSLLGGLATDMTTLIIARAVQGLGGGGLMILSQAAVADVVPARDRGRYMGILGGVFAVSSVAGPLLGGWFTEGPGWRWTFWMNVPLGIIAAVAVLVLLRTPARAARERRPIDVAGMVLLAIATSALVLIATWGGTVYDWVSLEIIGAAVVAVLASVAFVLVERRAPEPVIPLPLLRERTFVLSTVAGLLIAVAMFGTMGYLPTYFQMALGVSATAAGLMMVPLMASALVVSILSGWLVSRTGRYKAWPIVGAVLLAIGLALLSTTTADTSVLVIDSALVLIGAGIGTSMQLLTLIVQNAVPHAIVGTATAGQNFFRQVGGTLGAAVVGALFASRLTELLLDRLPSGGDAAGGISSLTPAIVNGLPDALREIVVTAYTDALMPIYLVLAPLALLAIVALAFIPERPLATTIEREGESTLA